MLAAFMTLWAAEACYRLKRWRDIIDKMGGIADMSEDATDLLRWYTGAVRVIREGSIQ
jgi:hypothetical protein